MFRHNEMRWRKRPWLLAALFAGVIVAVPIAAQAIVVGPCTGSVKIDGVLYGPANDSPQNPIVIPDKPGLIAEWTGETTQGPIKNHTGSVGIVVGPGSIVLAEWAGENADDETTSNGNYSIDEARDTLPVSVVGLYEVEARHSGDEGSCDGRVMVLIEGNPLTTPAGATAGVGTLLALGGLVAAGRGKEV